MTLTLQDVQKKIDLCLAAAALGMKVIEVDHEQGRAKFRMPLTPVSARVAGGDQFHGGALASFIDTAGDYAVALKVGAGVPTVNFRVDFLKPAFGSHVEADAIVRRVGRTICVADVEIKDPKGNLCAIGRCTYMAAAG